MDPQNNVQQQQQGESGNNGGSTSSSSGGLSSGASDSPRHLPHQGAAVQIDSADYFTLDGMQYNMSGDGTDAYNVQDLYHSGVFSSDDLYAVVDPSNPTATVTEIESDVPWQSASFIPIGTSDLRQLGQGDSSAASGTGDGISAAFSGRGMDISSSGGYTTNGSFYRLIALTNESNGGRGPNTVFTEASVSPTNDDTTSSAEAITATTLNGGDLQQPDVMASPAAGAQEGAAQVKVRKPRGRKPKHVKEAEAAAAAAAAAATLEHTPPSGEGYGSSSPSGSTCAVVGSPAGLLRSNLRERYDNVDDISPNVTVHHKPGGPSAAIPQPGAGPLSPYPQHQQQVSNALGDTAATRYSAVGHTLHQRQMSLEQLANHDRHAILMARRNNQGAPEAYSHPQYTQFQQTARHGLLSNQQQDNGAPTSHGYHQRRLYSEHPPGNRTAGANCSQGVEGRLDPFSRIPAPSNKSTVKPKIIQENRGIYNLLTAPATPRGSGQPPASYENRKLSQERWMQFPNPSILDESDPPSSSSKQDATADTAQLAPPHQHHSSLNPPSQHQVDHQHSSNSRIVFGRASNATQARVNIRRDGSLNPLYTFNHSQSFRAPSGGFHPQHRNPTGTGATPASCQLESGSGYHYTPQIEELNVRMETMAQNNYEMRCRAHYLAKVNRHLMMRLRQAYEKNEELKSIIQQNMEFSNDFLGADGANGVGRVRSSGDKPGGGPIFVGGPSSPYLDDSSMMRGVGGSGGSNDMSYYESVHGLSGLDPSLDNAWLPKRMTRDNAHLNQRYRKVLMTDKNGSLEGYTSGGGGKRPMNTSVSQPDQGNLPKKFCGTVSEKLEIRGEEVAAGIVEGKQGSISSKEGDEDKTSRSSEESTGGSSNNITDASSQSSVSGVIGVGGTEHVSVSSIKLELTSPVRDTGFGAIVSPDSIKSVATDVVTPSDDGDNTTSTVFNSPMSVGGPCFESVDFHTFTKFNSGSGVNSIITTNKAVGTGINEKSSNDDVNTKCEH